MIMMSAEKVYKEMMAYYRITGRVMEQNVFVSYIAKKFETKDIIDGLIMFNDFLDEQRVEV